MKHLILITILILTTSLLQAQWKLNSVALSTGKTPLTSGLTLSTIFSNEESYLILDFNNDLGEAISLFSLNNSLSAGPTGGFYKNTLWVAPILSFNLTENLSFLSWAGYSFGDPEKEISKLKPVFLFSFQQITFSIENFKFSYALQHYQKLNPEHIFGMKYIYDLNKSISTSASAGYMKNENCFIWAMGVKHLF